MSNKQIDTHTFNIGQELHRLASMPEKESQKLEQAVLQVLLFHIGRKSAISGARMLFELNGQGFDMKETRYFREVINKLRKKGYPIGSTGGVKGGYWICQNLAELEEFLNKQLHGPAVDMLEQETAIRKNGKRFYGSQMSFVN
ncbi:MAG: hypothetical protein GYA45_11705 [Pelolinea sp.]|nr:hypothetical protein [Pelolinea sp.]